MKFTKYYHTKPFTACLFLMVYIWDLSGLITISVIYAFQLQPHSLRGDPIRVYPNTPDSRTPRSLLLHSSKRKCNSIQNVL